MSLFERIRSDRPLASYHRVQLIVGALIRNRRAFAKLPPKGAYLDIGCGLNVQPGFHSIDYHWSPKLHICWDVTRGLPLPDNWIAGIFTEHMIEHIPIEAVYRLAEEIFRVLQPGAWVRIVVPSLDIYTRTYRQAVDGGKDEIPARPIINGDYTPAMGINSVFYDWQHRFMYDFQTLAVILGKAGFENLAERKYAEGADPKLLIDTDFRAAESLYVEGMKPKD